ncbi:hypothetical protein ACVWZ6_000272 [Bradyrhizobium sp. GM6.1]
MTLLAFPKPGWQAYNSAAEHLRGLGAPLAQFDFARVRTPAEMSVSLAVLEATNCCIGAIVRDLDGASAAGPIIELSRDLSHSIFRMHATSSLRAGFKYHYPSGAAYE